MEVGQNDPSPRQLTPTANCALATTSLVFGILGWTLLPVIGSIVAIIVGRIARREIRESHGSLTGDGLATAGLALGYTQLAIFLIPICAIALLVALSLAGPTIGDVYMRLVPLQPTLALQTPRYSAQQTSVTQTYAAYAQTPLPHGTRTPGACVYADEITPQDTGSTICVFGTIVSIHRSGDTTYIPLGANTTGFFITSPLVNPRIPPPGACVAIEGVIEVPADKPSIVLRDEAQLRSCP